MDDFKTIVKDFTTKNNLRYTAEKIIEMAISDPVINQYNHYISLMNYSKYNISRKSYGIKIEMILFDKSKGINNGEPITVELETDLDSILSLVNENKQIIVHGKISIDCLPHDVVGYSGNFYSGNFKRFSFIASFTARYILINFLTFVEDFNGISIVDIVG